MIVSLRATVFILLRSPALSLCCGSLSPVDVPQSLCCGSPALRMCHSLYVAVLPPCGCATVFLTWVLSAWANRLGRYATGISSFSVIVNFLVVIWSGVAFCVLIRSCFSRARSRSATLVTCKSSKAPVFSIVRTFPVLDRS
jgi:hypothetical protein